MSRTCIASTRWRDTTGDPDVVSKFSSMLQACGYRLKFSSISADFIFNCDGVSVAYIVFTNWSQVEEPGAWDRVAKMSSNFRRSFLLPTILINEDIRFIDEYFSRWTELQKTSMIIVGDWDKAVQTMLKLVDAHTGCKREDTVLAHKDEKLEFVTSTEAVVHVIRSIPGLDNHDAYSLLDGMGSIEAIAHASAESLKRHTDISHEKATQVEEFFRNDEYNRYPDLR